MRTTFVWFIRTSSVWCLFFGCKVRIILRISLFVAGARGLGPGKVVKRGTKTLGQAGVKEPLSYSFLVVSITESNRVLGSAPIKHDDLQDSCCAAKMSVPSKHAPKRAYHGLSGLSIMTSSFQMHGINNPSLSTRPSPISPLPSNCTMSNVHRGTGDSSFTATLPFFQHIPNEPPP